MAKEKEDGLFWFLLAVIGGGAIWAINKFIVPKSTNTTNNTSGTNTNISPYITHGTVKQPTVNLATTNGYPYSIDISKVVTVPNPTYGDIWGTVSSYTTTIGGKPVTYDVEIVDYHPAIMNKQYYLMRQDNNKLKALWAMYDGEINLGKFLGMQTRPLLGGGGCFIGETIITVPKGVKSIQDIKINDTVIGKDNALNKVIEIDTFTVNESIYGFNDIEPFVTGSHPFLTKNGWKSVDENIKHSDIEVSQLKVKDEILKVNESYLKLEKINEEYRGTIVVYSIRLGGNNTYYANGLCVHNKKIVKG